MQQAKLGQLLSVPQTKHLQTLRKWLNRSEYGNSFLRGRVEGVWDAEKGFDDFAVIQRTKWFGTGPSSSDASCQALFWETQAASRSRLLAT
jgi:hypothetical protein